MKFKLLLLITTLVLFSCRTGKISAIQVEKLAETTTSWNGDVLPAYPDGQPMVTVLKITIPEKTKLHKHYHPVINAGIVLKGTLKVIDKDDKVLILNEGDVIVELVNKIHYGINEGNKPVEIIVFYAGTEDLPITVLEDDE